MTSANIYVICLDIAASLQAEVSVAPRSNVVKFDLPLFHGRHKSISDGVHEAGRKGRAGVLGVATNMALALATDHALQRLQACMLLRNSAPSMTAIALL
jgi:hypothetical protein